MNQELYFSESQWRALREFAQALEDAYYTIFQSKFENARERFSLALKAATVNLDCDASDPEFFNKLARGIRRLPVTDKITVYGDGAEDFGVHVIQTVAKLVGEKVSKELARTGLWRRISYEYCYRPGGIEFFSQLRDGAEYPLLTVRFLWNEKDMSQFYDCPLNSLLIWLAKVPTDTKLPEALRIFRPFLTSINCIKLSARNVPSFNGWFSKNEKDKDANAGS